MSYTFTRFSPSHQALPMSVTGRDYEGWQQSVNYALQDATKASVDTSSGSAIVIHSRLLSDNTSYLFTGWVLGRRLSGGGSANDAYVSYFGAGFKRYTGTVSAIGSGSNPTLQLLKRDNVNFTFAMSISGTSLEWTVAGDSGVLMHWNLWMRELTLSI